MQTEFWWKNSWRTSTWNTEEDMGRWH